MLADRIKRQLTAGGYEELPVRGQKYLLMVRREKESARLVCLIENPDIFEGLLMKFDIFIAGLQNAVEDYLKMPCEILYLIESDDIGRDKWLAEQSAPVWLMEPSGKCVIFENQPSSFGTVQELLEKKVYPWTGILTDNGFIPWVTIVLVLINLVVQIIVALQESRGGISSLLYSMVLQIGDFYGNPEYYRLLSSAFLHFGWQHLFNNMLVLFFLGRTAERLAGRWAFLISYLLCAIGANVASVYWYAGQGKLEIYTAGASGAVFGVAGMLLLFVLANRGRVNQISSRRLIWMMAFTIYHGLAESGVNNCAHIAGAILGFLFGLIIWIVQNKKERNHTI